MNRAPAERQRGFTLIELLAVIAIIGILVSLLLPAVQTAREASRRLNCQNHEKQIALAVHSYHDLYKMLPPGESDGTFSGISAFTLLLEHLEQSSTFLKYNFSKGNNTPENLAVVSQRIPTYVCPSAVFVTSIPNSACNENRYPGNYAFCAGTFDSYGPATGAPPNNGAIIGKGSGTTGLKDILDGTSYTFLGGESHWFFRDYLFPASSPCAGQPKGGATYWAVPAPTSTLFNTRSIFNPKSWSGDSQRLSSFRSNHQGGVNMFHCDGSVRFTSELVGEPILDAYATRSGGEALSQ
jgi:prepilin-type N-terminal cleavage/methylation domain-containing protein/prepilin-type processing-associated H-X9-DG protein